MKKLLPLFFISISYTSFAQPSLKSMKLRTDLTKNLQPISPEMKLITSTQASILFDKEKITLKKEDALTWISNRLELRQDIDALKETGLDISTNDFSLKKVQQYYKGIKVEHGIINATSINGDLALMELEFYSIPDNFKTTPVLTEQQAFDKALAFVHAKTYAWTNYNGDDEDYQLPKAETVIVSTYKNEDEVCLAYKFNIYALDPVYRAYIYVNAWDGTIVLDDAIIKHAHRDNINTANNGKQDNISSNEAKEMQQNLSAPINNSNGTADTRYSGRRSIVTDLFAPGTAKPYRLRQTRNGHDIVVLNFQRKSYDIAANPTYEQQAIDFKDNNNDWTAAEYHNTFDTLNDAALDVMYNMQWVSDYWKNVHNRNGWDNNNGVITNYVHVWSNNNWFDNAFWNGKNMHFGDGNGGDDPPAASLDDCAHELGHGITSSTSNLTYRWESGALNEGFSDVWAACITNYAKKKDPTLTNEKVWRLFERSVKPASAKPGLRDMQKPKDFGHPDTYKSTNWKPGNFVDCRVETNNNDHCGVHTNSGVLNKWFFLITNGEAATNSKGQPYNITGMGFDTTEKIAYLTELNLTPNACFATAMNVSINAAISLYGYGSNAFDVVKAAWKAVGVDSNIYNAANTPVFTTNNFSSIAVDKNGYVWAGTSYNGLYRYDKNNWEKMTELPDVKINDIKADNKGGIWIAQAGRSGQTGGGGNIAGGVNYYASSTATTSSFYTASTQLQIPSRNARCMYVDNFRLNDGTNPKVWVATSAYITSSNSTSGMLGQGLYNSYKEFLPVSEGINIASGTAGCTTIGGNAAEVWTFAPANNGLNQLLSYNATTNALISTYDQNTVTALPAGFLVRAIYGDSKRRIWIGLATGGIVVYDELKTWHTINFSSIFPAGTEVNFNTITGDKYGDVYIGTTMGLAFFDAGAGQRNRLDDINNYKLYSTANGLPSDNIKGIAYDTTRFKVLLATDGGIIFWDPACIGNSCELNRTSRNGYAESLGNGNWSNPAIWSSGLVPDSTTTVVIKDTINVDITATCNSIGVTSPGSLNVNSGMKITIYENQLPIQTGEAIIRRRWE